MDIEVFADRYAAETAELAFIRENEEGEEVDVTDVPDITAWVREQLDSPF